MTEPKPPNKRVVSKPKYVAYLAQKVTLTTVSSTILVCGMMLILCAFLRMGRTLDSTRIGWNTNVFNMLCCALGGWLLLRYGMALDNRTDEIEPVLPSTRENVKQLPAEETLVRASTEPTQQQEKVLLRAATAGAETPPEQLLRPDAPKQYKSPENGT
jgi:hypothetical protein